MRQFILFTVIVLAALCQGCLVPSIHPLYHEEDILPVNGIEGSWVEDDETNAWNFAALDDNTYRITYVEDGDTSVFSAVFLLLNEKYLFMDAYPDGPDNLSDVYKMHLVAVHSFWRVNLSGDSLTISVLESDWLTRVIDSAGVTVNFEWLDNDEVLLTASTDELQTWMAGIAEEPAAFSPVQLFRKN